MLLQGMMRWIRHDRNVTKKKLTVHREKHKNLELDRVVERDLLSSLHHQREWLARKHIMAIVTHTEKRLLITSFRGWASLVKLKSEKRKAFNAACRHWKNAELAKAFESWKLMHQKRQHTKHVLIKVLDHMSHRNMSKAWHTWKGKIVRVKHQHHVMGHMMKRLTHRLAYRAFSGWAHQVKRMKRVRTILRRTLERIEHHNVFGAFNKWLDLVRIRKNLSFIMLRVASRWHHIRLLWGFNRWQLYHNTHRHVVKFQSHKETHDYRVESSRQLLVRRLILHMKYSQLSRAWATWTSWIDRDTHRKGALRSILNRWIRRSMEIGFASWCTHTHIHRHNELEAYVLHTSLDMVRI